MPGSINNMFPDLRGVTYITPIRSFQVMYDKGIPRPSQWVPLGKAQLLTELWALGSVICSQSIT